jgi:hypothetical protein
MLSIINEVMLSIAMLNVVMLSVMLNAIMLSLTVLHVIMGLHSGGRLQVLAANM